MEQLEYLAVGLCVLITATLLYQAVRILRYALISTLQSKRTVPFSIEHVGATKRFLVIGDSTAKGVGAKDPHNSVPGRLAADFPFASIENRARSARGMQYMLTLLRQLETETTQKNERKSYDVLVIMGGGIDVAYMRSLKAQRQQFIELLGIARRLAGHVLVIAPYNTGHMPSIQFPWSRLLAYRSALAEQMFKEVAKSEHVALASLYAPSDVFVANPRGLRSPDLSHPNDEGYGILYAERIRPVLFELFQASHA